MNFWPRLSTVTVHEQDRQTDTHPDTHTHTHTDAAERNITAAFTVGKQNADYHVPCASG